MSKWLLFDDDWKDVPTPTGWTWELPFTVQRNGRQFRAKGFDVSTYVADFSGTTYWVKLDGNDADTGLDEAHALAKVQTALLKADVGKVMVKAGVYSAGLGWDFVSPARSLKVIGYGGAVIISPHVIDLTWTAVDAHYSTTIASCSYVLDMGIIDTLGDGLPLVLAADEAAVEATANTWYFAGGTLYVHTSDSRAPDTNIWPYLTGGNGSLNDAVTYYVENLKLYGGLLPFWAAEDTAGAKFYSKNCEFKYGYSTSGFRVQGCDEVILQNPVVAHNYVDGLKAEYLTSRSCNLAIINPRSYSNGLLNSTSVQNSYSRHGIGSTVIIGGEFWGNKGRTIHDASDASGSPSSWILGLYGHDPVVASAYDVNFVTTGGELFLDSCRSAGGTYDLESGVDGQIHYYRMQPDPPSSTGAGTVDTYDGSSPAPPPSGLFSAGVAMGVLGLTYSGDV